MFEYAIVRDGQTATVTIQGELVASVIPELRPVMQNLAQEVSHIVIDGEQMSMLDSMGIGFVIATYNSLNRRHGTLTLCNLNPDVKQLLVTLRLDRRFTITGSQS